MPTLFGASVSFLNLDNAATTAPLQAVAELTAAVMADYGSIHRGFGYKARVSTQRFDDALDTILHFVGASPDAYQPVLTSNTTTAINKLTRLLQPSGDDVVFLSEYEHSSNDLPWRSGGGEVRRIRTIRGRIDLEHLELELQKSGRRRRRIIALSGASNISGVFTPLDEASLLAERYDALLCVDGAQLVAHRRIDVGSLPRLDAIAFSGHKMYAPYGGGVLVVRRSILDHATIDDIGGGTVDYVTNDAYDLARDYGRRLIAGTPNFVGIIALARAGNMLRQDIGFDVVAAHEQALLDRLRDLKDVPGIEIYDDGGYCASSKAAIAAFNIRGLHPGLLAARLGWEFGIAVRAGAICQFAYVAKLLGLTAADVATARSAVAAGRTDEMYGLVRASFGLENEPNDVARLRDALEHIAGSPEMSSVYSYNFRTGEFEPANQHGSGGERS